MSQEFEQALDGVDDGRRSFLKKMAITTAFAAPVVSSFTMTGIKAVYAQTPSVSGAASGQAAATTTTAAANQTTATTAGPNQTTTTTSTSTTTTTTRPPTTTTTMQQNSTQPLPD